MPIYDEYLTHAEMQRWILEADVAWGRIDVALARSQPDLLDQVRDSALIESYFPVYTTRLVRALAEVVCAAGVFGVAGLDVGRGHAGHHLRELFHGVQLPGLRTAGLDGARG